MIDTLFDMPGRFYRGSIHGHSNMSDGALSPEEVCRRYRAKGYDFISITDHFVGRFGYPITDTSACSDGSFTTIPGAELHSGRMENGALWHLVAVGLPTDFQPSNSPAFDPVPDQETGPEIARRARAAGAFVAIAHPHWSGLTLADALSIEAAHAIEAYNHGCDVAADRGEGFHILDLLLSAGRRINLCAADDAHFRDFDGFGGWVMVRAADNTPAALVEALRAGHYYSSQGPEYRRVTWDGDDIQVECSAVERVIVQGNSPLTVSVHGPSMTRIRLPVRKLAGSPWMRITIADAAGRRAWTNPVWKD
jgi:hypothetical protein